MAAFKALGKFLEGSGWTHVLSNAAVATSGVSDSDMRSTQSRLLISAGSISGNVCLMKASYCAKIHAFIKKRTILALYS